MKNFFFQIGITVVLMLLVLSCGPGKAIETPHGEEAITLTEEERQIFDDGEEEAVEISDDETEYEIIIIDPGFNTWLRSIARPEGYYSQNFLETRNQILVTNWNQRAIMPLQFNPNLYQMQIDYSPHIDYGYEVNYKLYNYFIFFQRRYNQRLGPWLPRI